MCLVGSRHYNTFGSHGSAAHVPLAYFASLDECCAWLRKDKGRLTYGFFYAPFHLSWLTIDCPLCAYGIPETMFAGCHIIGVEITHAAQAVHTHPFHGNTAFMLGNEVGRCTP